MKALRSSASAIALRIFGLLNGGGLGLTIRLVETLVGASSQMAFGACDVDVLEQRHGDVGDERHVELAGHEGQHARRAVVDDLPLDAVEIGLALLPVVGIAHELDRIRCA